jgi:hypothetical protein
MSRTSTATTLSRVDAVADVTVRSRSGEPVVKKWRDLSWTIRWGVSGPLLIVPELGRTNAFFVTDFFLTA